MTKPNFYVPNVAMWNWRLISAGFVRIQLDRANRSYSETDNALVQLDADVDKIEQEIRGKWASANVQVMRAFEARLKEVGAERKRIHYVRTKLRTVIDRMRSHLEAGKAKV